MKLLKKKIKSKKLDEKKLKYSISEQWLEKNSANKEELKLINKEIGKELNNSKVKVTTSCNFISQLKELHTTSSHTQIPNTSGNNEINIKHNQTEESKSQKQIVDILQGNYSDFSSEVADEFLATMIDGNITDIQKQNASTESLVKKLHDAAFAFATDSGETGEDKTEEFKAQSKRIRTDSFKRYESGNSNSYQL